MISWVDRPSKEKGVAMARLLLVNQAKHGEVLEALDTSSAYWARLASILARGIRQYGIHLTNAGGCQVLLWASVS